MHTSICTIYSYTIAMHPKLVVFASGSKDGGGSGFENLVRNTPRSSGSTAKLCADIVAVVSNHEHGGVRERAERLSIPFMPCTVSDNSYYSIIYNTIIQKDSVAGMYQSIVKELGADFVALSGWLKKVEGLNPAKTFNIHPALLSQLGGRFGGKGMWGHHIHEAVRAAFDAGDITETGFSMHFVTDEFDRGPVFFEHRIPLAKDMSVDDIANVVQAAEHTWQPVITNKVVQGEIYWDGVDARTLVGAMQT